MLIVSLIAVVGTLCWLVFTFAVYAVPAFVGLSAAMFAHQTGAGTLGAVAVGLLAGSATLVLGQRMIAASRSPALTLAVTMLFAAPAALAGFHAVHAISAVGVPDGTWRILLALAGGAIVAATAWSRFSALARSDPSEAARGSCASTAVRAADNV